MTILVMNVGSTTLKYALFDPARGFARRDGLVDRIGQPGGDAPDHVTAAHRVLGDIGTEAVHAIGHRIVQGGDCFREPTRVDAEVIERLRTLDSLAPLHNPAARQVVEGLVETSIPQTLVFDTAYFSTLAPEAFRYAVPDEWYRDQGVRRYGFHGTSHQYVTRRALSQIGTTGKPIKLVSLHLGGGASATASLDGVAVDTSMGMTPLEGLVMATRSGDLDPSIIVHMMRTRGLTVDEIDRALNHRSGLFGVCGESDMRAVLQREGDGDESARLAVSLFVRRIAKTVGGFAAMLQGLDVLVFTAGIGEHSPEIRSRVCRQLGFLGVTVDESKNQAIEGEIAEISDRNSRVKTLVIATDEERAIADQVL